jgi:cell division protease FtsH
LTAAMVGVAVYFVRHVNKFSGGRDNKTTKSKAVRVDHTGKTLDDFEGDHNIKDEIRNLVSFLKDPSRAKRLGAKIPRGTLLVGPPGTGKTLLAKAIAGEANVPFFSLSGSDFVEMFVGVGSARVRDMFEEAKKAAPCIIFIDELDAVGRHRGAGLGGGNDEREQTLNQLLVEMDGFGTDTDVIVIAATNRHDILDPALLRPGRFDLTLSVSNPDRNGRYRILQVHARNKPLTEEARDYLKELAAKTPGFSGADLEGVLNHAALVRLYRIYREEDVLRKQAQELETRLLAEGKTEDETKAALAEADLSPEKILLRLPPEEISIADVLEGKWRVIAGTRGDREQTEDELLNTAVHEILHAFISEKDYQENNGGQPVREVNCIQRQRALGVTVTTPDHDAVSTSDVEIRAKVRMGMGGRAGQKVILGRVDSGAANDFEQATSLLREYVMRFGMDEEIGPLHVGESGGQPFLGKSMGAARQSTIGEDLANLIDRRMQFWSKQLMFEAETIAAENKTMLLAMAKELLQDEEWTRKEWLAQLRKHGCDKLFGWRLDYGELRYDFVAQPVIV